MPKVIKHFDLPMPKKGEPTVDGSADYPVDTRTHDGITFVTLTLLAEKVTIGGEVAE